MVRRSNYMLPLAPVNMRTIFYWSALLCDVAQIMYGKSNFRQAKDGEFT
jgi:hypothetical protein